MGMKTGLRKDRGLKAFIPQQDRWRKGEKGGTLPLALKENVARGRMDGLGGREGDPHLKAGRQLD